MKKANDQTQKKRSSTNSRSKKTSTARKVGTNKTDSRSSTSTDANSSNRSSNSRSKKTSAARNRTSQSSRASTARNRTSARKTDGSEVFAEGRVQGHPRGFAFVLMAEGNDIFVPPHALNGAMHGDLVRVRLVSTGKSEGEVDEILQKASSRVIGTYRLHKGYGVVTPDEKRFLADIYVYDGYGKASTGDKVVAEINRSSSEITGRIVENLGDGNSREAQILSIMRAHGIYEEFKASTLKEAAQCDQTVSAEGREDFRDSLLITIDGEDARDLDDAVAVRRLDSGDYELAVHIADVSHYVTAGSALDKEALRRGTSVYFADRVAPMLPRELSNGICSLNAKEDRLALSCIITIGSGGEVLSYRLTEAIIRVTERMSYTDCNAMFDGDQALCARYAHILPMLAHMRTLAKMLTNKRTRRGAIDFDLVESKIIIAADGEIEQIKPYPRGESQRIIEEFMLCANECVAEFGIKNELPLVHRVHEEPSPEKLATLAEFLDSLGVRVRGLSKGVSPLVLQQLLAQVSGKPYYTVASRVMLRSMQKARYAPESLGHFGLAAEFYCHFTSPIRRYPDLAVHRIVKSYLRNKSVFGGAEEFVDSASRLSSERERAAEQAERDADDYFKAEYMRRFVGDSFTGVISGVTGFGIFVELDNTCEGFVAIENLPDDGYLYEENRFRLKGRDHAYALGDQISIIVAAVRADNRIDFVLST